MVTRVFTSEQLKELLWDGTFTVEGTAYSHEVVIDRGDSRWSTCHSLIFKGVCQGYDTFWETPVYRLGKTEHQDNDYWDSEEVECLEVKPVEKTIVVLAYEPV